MRWLPDRTAPRAEFFAGRADANNSTRWRQRFAPVLLVVAAILVWQVLGARVPRDHEVAIDLGASSPSVTSVELTWTDPRANTDRENPVATTRWNFATGTAPSRLNAHVRVADGEWQADVDITRNDRPDHARWSRRVYLEGSQVVLALREALQ